MKVDILGVQVDSVTKHQALERVLGFARSGQPHRVATVYSEFVVEAHDNPAYRALLNSADLALADGVGILWAAKFLSLPKRGDVLTFINWLGSLASIIIAPESLKTVLPEKISGSRLIWDIAEMAAMEGFSLALVGGIDGVAEKSALLLKEKFPGLKVSLAYGPPEFDRSVVQRISQSNSDILLIAYSALKQEPWLAENLSSLNVKVAMGLGGTFDYLAGKREAAPEWMYRLGLEWLWRLVTQPERAARMWRAVPVFSLLILQHKLKQ